ncbi:hypothetical protein F5144DRAFT_569883 [Chaetomium tenue]|uniref:Uncharacterized protein n=1 Tax=Chaetomium tenue TaxID=1854479 RepID=A0ACB7PEI8_9PEZI|nr:hypothetical protein F5144DRAFT_569883 [Chaetomium globosum]
MKWNWTRGYSAGVLVVILLALLGLMLGINFTNPPRGHIPRSPGGDVLKEVSDTCHGNDPAQFLYHQCSEFINCFLHNTSEVLKADMAVGTTLVSLLPTILLLIAKPPMDLVQQGLISPHRALAMACFSIGLPQQMFSKLRPVLPGFWKLEGKEANRTRVLEIPVPIPTKRPFLPFASRVFTDFVVLACAGVMLWRTWAVSSWVMVPWKCESSILQFAWPVGCLFWMALVLPLLHVMSDNIEFINCLYPQTKYTWPQVFLLPYTQRFRPRMEDEMGGLSAEEQDRMRCIRVVITMPYTSGFRSWLVYDLIIEILGSALYFYGTFVWLSCVFLTAVPAIGYVGATVACYVAMMAINSLF